jgi:hypothetical protein
LRIKIINLFYKSNINKQQSSVDLYFAVNNRLKKGNRCKFLLAKSNNEYPFFEVSSKLVDVLMLPQLTPKAPDAPIKNGLTTLFLIDKSTFLHVLAINPSDSSKTSSSSTLDPSFLLFFELIFRSSFVNCTCYLVTYKSTLGSTHNLLTSVTRDFLFRFIVSIVFLK